MWYALILAPSLCDLETNPPPPPCVSAAQKFGNTDGVAWGGGQTSVSKNCTVENNVQDEKKVYSQFSKFWSSLLIRHLEPRLSQAPSQLRDISARQSNKVLTKFHPSAVSPSMRDDSNIILSVFTWLTFHRVRHRSPCRTAITC